MLAVVFVNMSKLADVSDYDVFVQVNNRVIHKDKVTGHRRADGWQALLQRYAEQVKDKP